MPYSPNLTAPTEISYQRGINFDYTRAVVADAIGEERISVMDTMHRPTLEHGYGTGEMVADVLKMNDYRPDVVELGALMGGLHDSGKFRDDLLAWITYEGDYGYERRKWVTSEHSKEGADRLRKWGADADDAGLRFAAFAARHHHNEIPDDYADYGTARYRLGWALTHLVKRFDVLNALACDTSREYVAKREGKVLSPGDIYDIVGKVAGKGDIILLGRKVEVETYTREVLDLP